MQVFIDDCLSPAPSSAAPPWRYLPHLLLLAFLLRAALALSGDFIVQPDEIMQYLEPAHTLAFGSGILHWEYYYGARSWLVPYALAAILFLCKFVGLGEPAYYIPAVKLALCALSLLIPLCMYHLGRRLFGEESGRAALLLGVFWYELVGFAHKPMTEFIATGLLLALMVLALRPHLSATQATVASAFAVFVVAVRLQYAPLVGLVWLLPLLRATPHTRLLMLAAAAATVCAVGVFDTLTWGAFLHPYRTVFHYNAALDEQRVFYEETTGYYALWLLIASGGLIVPALLGVKNSRPRMLLLLLCLAVLLPHETQVHREYRYIYALIPLWLLLCADVLCTGWRKTQTSPGAVLRWRRYGIWAWAALVSAAGIANALPWQLMLYQHNPQDPENREHPYLGRYLHGQDEVLALYRQLATEPSVRGVKDSLRLYSDSGGYYMLHRKVPFYDKGVAIPPSEIRHYVSHIIAAPSATMEKLGRAPGGALVVLTKGGSFIRLPAYIGDTERGKLMHWKKSEYSDEIIGQVVEGFALVQAGSQFTLWKAEPPSPVHTWKDYRIYLSNAGHHQLLEKAMGNLDKPPVRGHSFEFAQHGAQQ